MYKLALNLRATKRLYFHQVLNDENELVFTSKHADECFKWLCQEGKTEFLLLGQGAAWRVTLGAVEV